jgi:hypothetical protein
MRSQYVLDLWAHGSETFARGVCVRTHRRDLPGNPDNFSITPARQLN